MPNMYTIYMPVIGYENILGLIKADSLTSYKLMGTEPAWDQVYVYSDNASMKLTPSVFTRPQDSFSKSVLGVCNLFRNVDTPSVMNKEFVLDTLASTKMIVGCVCEPEVNDDQIVLLLSILSLTNGLLFTGSAIVDSFGTVLLEAQCG